MLRNRCLLSEPCMCLKLSYLAAMYWKQKAHNIISNAVAAKIGAVPLLSSCRNFRK
jgi:hypothetical protein